MPTLSIWINPKTYEDLEELAKFLNIKPSKLIKEILENKIINKNLENYYLRVKDLYKWYYYQGTIIDNEKYIKRVLKKKNAEAILNIINLHDDVRIILKTLGILMLIVSLKSYAKIPEESFSLLKLIKYNLIEDAKHIKVYSLPLLFSKILWVNCVEKIRELSISRAKNWESLAFTAGLYAVTILGQMIPEEIFTKYNLKSFEREWNELIKNSIRIMNEEEKIVVRCALCRAIVNGPACNCGSSEVFYEDLNI
ncbi:MAG: hypothetical protein QXV69_07050 [Sulfolobaceae archaeon]